MAENTASRRVALLRQQLSPEGPADELGALSLEPTASTATSALQHELQMLLEHDSHAERQRMKELMATGDLFVP